MIKPHRTMEGLALAVLLSLGLALPGCASQDTGTQTQQSATEQTATTTESEQSEQADFTTKEAPIFRAALTDEKATLRFYSDTPSIAYISVADFYKILLPQGTMDVSAQDDGTWLLESHTGADEKTAMENGLGGSATVDPKAGTLTSPDLPAFTNVMSLVQDGMDNTYLDGAAYIRVASVEYDKPAEPTTIDLSKYGITVHTDDDGVYLPVQTLSAMFSDLHLTYVAYNGDKLYVNDDNLTPFMDERDPDFNDTVVASTDRSDDMIKFSYAQFCFAFEYFYGKPSKAPEALITGGFDAYLESLGEDGKTIKEALMSKDLLDYYHGLSALQSTIKGDGHTALSAPIAAASLTSNTEVQQRNMEFMQDQSNTLFQIMMKSNMDPDQQLTPSNQMSVEKAHNEFFGDDTYKKQGDTAIIALNTFGAINYNAWRDYYDGKGERPSATDTFTYLSMPSKVSTDSLAVFVDGLDRAKADPEVKNVVIDLTNNSGGSLDVLMAISSLVANIDSVTYQNVLTGQKETEHFEVDRNLDGKFDEKDVEVDYSDLNFAVLTSCKSFSCGNLLPSILKDAGYPIIGEQSDGGTCAITMQVTGEGQYFPLSSWRMRLINKAGEDIDAGIPVDVDLLKRADAQLQQIEVEQMGQKATIEAYDYSSFFDLDNLKQVMDEFYAGKGTTSK